MVSDYKSYIVFCRLAFSIESFRILDLYHQLTLDSYNLADDLYDVLNGAAMEDSLKAMLLQDLHELNLQENQNAVKEELEVELSSLLDEIRYVVTQHRVKNAKLITFGFDSPNTLIMEYVINDPNHPSAVHR